MISFAWFVLGVVLGIGIGYMAPHKQESTEVTPEEEAAFREAMARIEKIDPDPTNPKE